MCDTKIIKFKCPSCGSTRLEEILCGATLTSEMDTITEGENGIEVKYDLLDHEGGEVDHYQCNGCGFCILDENDFEITNNDDLVEWIKKNCPE